MKIHETEDDGDVLAFLTGQVSDQIVCSHLTFLNASASRAVLLLLTSIGGFTVLFSC